MRLVQADVGRGGDRLLRHHDLVVTGVDSVRCSLDPASERQLIENSAGLRYSDDVRVQDDAKGLEAERPSVIRAQESLELGPVGGHGRTHSDRPPVTHPKIFEDLCGSDYPRNVVLVTTMWSKIAEADALRREDELRKIYWKPMVDLGSNVIRYQDTAESAWGAVKLLLPADVVTVPEGQPASGPSSGISQPLAQTESQNAPIDDVVIA